MAACCPVLPCTHGCPEAPAKTAPRTTQAAVGTLTPGPRGKRSPVWSRDRTPRARLCRAHSGTSARRPGTSSAIPTLQTGLSLPSHWPVTPEREPGEGIAGLQGREQTPHNSVGRSSLHPHLPDVAQSWRHPDTQPRGPDLGLSRPPPSGLDPRALLRGGFRGPGPRPPRGGPACLRRGGAHAGAPGSLLSAPWPCNLPGRRPEPGPRPLPPVSSI